MNPYILFFVFFLKILSASSSERVIQNLNIPYHSSKDKILLYTSAIKTGTARKPILVYLPGFDANRYFLYRDLRNKKNLLDRFFLVGPEMRGRGAKGKKPFGGTADYNLFKMLPQGPVSEGTADINGWELVDIIDAIEEVKRKYPNDVLDQPIYIIGHSGGAGNILGLLGKFPDYFTAAYAASGISDYESWAQNSYWKDRLKSILKVSVNENPKLYRSRGGVVTAMNRLTPLYIAHGFKDEVVPFQQAQSYIDVSNKYGKLIKINNIKNGTHDIWGKYNDIVKFITSYHNPPLIPDKGELTVSGYLYSKKFKIILPSVESISEFDYDLENFKFSINKGDYGLISIDFSNVDDMNNLKCISGFLPLEVQRDAQSSTNSINFKYQGRKINCAKTSHELFLVLKKIATFDISKSDFWRL